MKANIAILVCLAINAAASQRAVTAGIPKGSVSAPKASSHRLLSKSEKGKKGKSSKGEDDKTSEGSKSDSISVDSGESVVESAEEKPQMIMVAPLESSTIPEASTETQGPTPGPTQTQSQGELAEDTVIANATNSTIGDELPAGNTTQTPTASPKALDEGPNMQCPLPGYLEYVIPAKTFFSYAHVHGNTSVVLSVTDTCSYIIEDGYGEQDIVFASSPLEWLDLAVRHFGGAPRKRQAQMLTGVSAPSLLDLDVLDRGASVFEVVIAEISASVGGDKPISWIFLSELEAKDFEYFVASLIRYAPAVFLTNDSTACGSGPFCNMVGNLVCYHDAKNSSLGILHLNGDEESYSDAFEWFSGCVGALECSSGSNGTTFSYSSCPMFAVNGTTFSFVDESNISFQCPTENAVSLVAVMIQMLSIDPFHPLTIGASDSEPASHHSTNTTDCMV